LLVGWYNRCSLKAKAFETEKADGCWVSHCHIVTWVGDIG